jgi:TrmH family RNA methyltransferase
MNIPPISSKENPRIKWARKLQQRRVRQAEGLMLIEGVRLVADAWAAGVRPTEIFFEAEALRGTAKGGALLGELQAAGVHCLPVTPAVFAEVSETVSPQGIAAVVPLPSFPAPAQPTLALLLDGVRDPGNAGTLLRTAEAVGVQLVLFGPGTVDPLNGKVVRAAMGAHFRLPIVEFGDWSEVEAILPGVALFVAEMEAPTAYDKVEWCAPSALVVGGEAEGASDEARRRATPVAIPMAGRAESLNAAMAGAVILFEAARQRRHSASGR